MRSILAALLAALLLVAGAAPVLAVSNQACAEIFKAATRAEQAHPDSAGAEAIRAVFVELGCSPP